MGVVVQFEILQAIANNLQATKNPPKRVLENFSI
jgi:hypothetical protein